MRLKNNIKELDEILKTAGQSGNIDLSDVQKHIEMLRRKTILEQHKYTVFFAKDGYWKTYVPDPDSKKGRRLIKRRDRDELDDAIVKEYRAIENYVAPTMRNVYPLWIEHYTKKSRSQNTVKRAVATWNKYYAHDKIIGKRMDKITPTAIESWLHTRIKEEGMNAKQFYNMSLPFRQIFAFAAKSKIIDNNVFDEVDVNSKLFAKRQKPKSETQVFTETEEFFLMKLAWSEWQEDHSLGACLALILLFYTGMRIGEVVALKREDIEGMYVHINRAEVEVSDQVNPTRFVQVGHMVVDYAKTSAAHRDVYLSQGGREVIDVVSELAERRCSADVLGANPDAGYLFMNGNKRCNVDAVTYRVKKYCKILGIPFRSTHKIRKTYVSKLIDGGINIDAIREQIGHEDEETTYRCYCFNRKTKAETNILFEKALSTVNTAS